MTRTVIRGATIADGLGMTTFSADVVIDGPIIERLAEPGSQLAADVVIDAQHSILMPGLIDAHHHGDAAVLDPATHEALTRQGVTTVVLGQDGLSFAPSPAGEFDACHYASDYFACINGSHPRFSGGSVAELLDTYDDASTANTAYLAPHGTIRYAVMGPSQQAADDEQIAAMTALLRAAITDGARGMSTGLEYAPACYADTRELTALCAVLAEHGLPHVSHMRGYEEKASVAVAELADLARTTGVATHISHYHGPSDVLVPLIDDLRAEGLDVTFDSYPYLCGASILALIALPSWLPLADPAKTLAHLADPDIIARLDREHFPAKADMWARVTLASVPAPGFEWTEGMRLVEVAEQLGEQPSATAVRLLRASDLKVSCVFAQPPTNSEESVRELMRHPAHCAGSDGITIGGHPHPRAWGTFARYLARHTRELGDWDWAQAAIHLSGNAARRFGLNDRGVIAAGHRADLALIDPARIHDDADYAHPRRPARGVTDVWVRGIPVLAAETMTGALPGRSVRA